MRYSADKRAASAASKQAEVHGRSNWQLLRCGGSKELPNGSSPSTWKLMMTTGPFHRVHFSLGANMRY